MNLIIFILSVVVPFSCWAEECQKEHYDVEGTVLSLSNNIVNLSTNYRTIKRQSSIGEGIYRKIKSEQIEIHDIVRIKLKRKLTSIPTNIDITIHHCHFITERKPQPWIISGNTQYYEECLNK